jgi:Uma2 family endonuclease
VRSDASISRAETLGELLEQLGGVAPHRVRLHPTPGKATEQDVIRIHDRTNRLFELVDGVLVEKVMGFREAYLACQLIKLVGAFIDQQDLGILVGADGIMRLMPGLVRIPDVAFISWERLGARVVPSTPIPDLVPDVAMEVLSEGNTLGEMKRKLKEYFLAGVRRVWFVDPGRRTVQIFTAPDRSSTRTMEQSLDGGDVLPGLKLPVRRIFEHTPPPEKKARKATERRRRNGSKGE